MFRNSHQIWADKRDVNKIANNVENVIGDINVMKNSLQEMVTFTASSNNKFHILIVFFRLI